MSLGVKLRRIRHDKNWSQAEAAQKLNISQPAYHLWETDQTKPTTDNLLRIAEVFEVDIYDLLQGNSNVIISNNTIENSVVYPSYSTINMQSPELLESVLKNQEQITKLLDLQNKLIENLLRKD